MSQRSLPILDSFREALEKQGKRNSWGPNRPFMSSPANNGEKCRSCKHRVQIGGYSKTFYKCKLAEKHWTHSTKTDIKLRDDACNFWESENAES